MHPHADGPPGPPQRAAQARPGPPAPCQPGHRNSQTPVALVRRSRTLRTQRARAPPPRGPANNTEETLRSVPLQASPAAPASVRRPHAQGAPPGRAAGWPSRGSSSLRFTSRKAAPKADTKPGPCSMLLRAWATRQPLHPRSQQDARGRRGRQDGAARAQPYDTLGACRARSLARRPPRISHAAAARMSRTRAGLQARLKTRSSLRARGGPAIRAAGRARAGSDDLHVRQRVPPALPAP